MAVLRIPLAPAKWRWTHEGRDNGQVPDRGVVRQLSRIFTAPLPEDMSSEECSVALLFRSSRALNYVTGGAPDMTFSARCHARRRAARSASVRAAWHLAAMGIDMACGVLRGETQHCATAWVNHVTRQGRSE